MSVNDASALEDTLSRLRSRYTLYFNLPEAGDRNIQVDLSVDARARYRDAEVRYRRTSMLTDGSSSSDNTPLHVTRAPSEDRYSAPPTLSDPSTPPTKHRRVAVNEDGSPIAPPDPDKQQ
jgi:hypothetical protein